MTIFPYALQKNMWSTAFQEMSRKRSNNPTGLDWFNRFQACIIFVNKYHESDLLITSLPLVLIHDTFKIKYKKCLNV